MHENVISHTNVPARDLIPNGKRKGLCLQVSRNLELTFHWPINHFHTSSQSFRSYDLASNYNTTFDFTCYLFLSGYHVIVVFWVCFVTPSLNISFRTAFRRLPLHFLPWKSHSGTSPLETFPDPKAYIKINRALKCWQATILQSPKV